MPRFNAGFFFALKSESETVGITALACRHLISFASVLKPVFTSVAIALTVSFPLSAEAM